MLLARSRKSRKRDVGKINFICLNMSEKQVMVFGTARNLVARMLPEGSSRLVNFFNNKFYLVSVLSKGCK